MTTVEQLETRLAGLVRRLESTPVYSAVFRAAPDPEVVTALLREIYKEIAAYQPHVTEATFTAVGRMPKREAMVRTMILQQVEEVEHAEMARRDYLALGGVDDRAPMSPESAAVAATCRFLGERGHPASYLGFMYLFEALTPMVSARVQHVMQAVRYPSAAREFVDLHAVEDIRHTDQVAQMIQDVEREDPAAGQEVLWGFDVFAAVYPIPLWSACFDRAVSLVKA